MPKSRVRKKNGKKVKYTPQPKGLSKTKMNKLMEMIAQQQKAMEEAKTNEIVSEGQPVAISPEFTKKLNMVSPEEIQEGPVLSSSEGEEK